MPLILVAVVVLIVVLGALVLIWARLKRGEADLEEDARRKRPRGYWVSTGISIGAGLGVALGTAFDHLALGIAFGAAIGVAIGTALEARKQDELREPTESERSISRLVLVLGLIVGSAFLAAIWFLGR